MQNQKEKIKKLYLAILSILLIISIIYIFLTNSNYNFSKSGHNMSNKNIKEIEEYILNISSYRVEAEVTITSNKTTNKYVIEQEYSNEKIVQKILEPENIKGLEMCYENNTLTLTNTRLNISKTYEDYKYIANNYLDLITFIDDYKKESSTKLYEEDEKYILEVEINENKYIANKKLTIDTSTGNIESLEIEDMNQKELVYILYREIEIN